ncbi:MAG: cyclase family protein [Christensenella sp.]
MEHIDLSGVIKQGIWRYGQMYPHFIQRSIQVEPSRFFCEIFDGFHSQTGTYLETTAHLNGYEGQKLIQDIQIESFIMRPCYVLKLDKAAVKANNNRITREILQVALGNNEITPNSAILFCAGVDDWYDESFLSNAPFLTRNAMEWLIAQKPFLIGSDTPAWEAEEPVFDLFAKTDILLLAPLVNLEKVTAYSAYLTVLPLNIPNTCCVPCRAVLTQN